MAPKGRRPAGAAVVVIAAAVVAAGIAYAAMGGGIAPVPGVGGGDVLPPAPAGRDAAPGAPVLEGEVTIGILLPLTGDLATHGTENLEGTKLGIADFNSHLAEAGAGWSLKALAEDSATSPVIALERLASLYARGVPVVIGPIASSSIQNIKGYADSNNMLLVSCCSSASSLAIPDDSVYRLIPDDSNQGVAIGKLLDHAGVEVMVPIWRGDTWGDGLKDSSTRSFQKRGGLVDSGIRYNPELTEFSASLSLLAQSVQEHVDRVGADRVGVLFLGFDEALHLMQSASEYGVLGDIRWFGPGTVTRDLKLVTDPIGAEFTNKVAFTTVQVAASQSPTYERVQAHLTDTLGVVPNTFVHFSYDAAWVVGLSILEAQGLDVTEIKRVLPAVAGNYSGSIGSTKLNPAGDLMHVNYEVWGVRDGEWLGLGQYDHIGDSVVINDPHDQ